MAFDKKEWSKKYKQTEKGKETRQKANKKYYKTEAGKESRQKYDQTENGKKSKRISDWKYRGVKSDNFDELYEYYVNCWECENCGVELIEGLYGNNKKCLDHCHITGEFRNVLCHYCNLLRKE